MDDYQRMEELLERFFEGRTSNGEERQLYRFFAQASIPEHLSRYRPVFRYFETDLADECKALKSSVQPVCRSHKKRWIAWAGIAASLLAGVLLSVFFLKKTTPFEPYEGSYIVRNGVHITDMNLIRSELEATVRNVLQQEAEFERRMEKLNDAEDKYLRKKQEIEKQYCEIVNRFKDPYIREEVKKILEINCNY
jgi:hypothetical protein